MESFSSFFTRIIIYSSERDWREQHAKFHKQFLRAHPKKKSASFKRIYTSLCSDDDKRAIKIGLDGKNLKINVVRPFLYSNPDNHDDDGMLMVL